MMSNRELDMKMVRKMRAAKAKRLRKEVSKKKLQDRIAMFKIFSLSGLSLIGVLLAGYLGGTVNTYNTMNEKGMIAFIALFMGMVSTILMMMGLKSLGQCQD